MKTNYLIRGSIAGVRASSVLARVRKATVPQFEFAFFVDGAGLKNEWLRFQKWLASRAPFNHTAPEPRKARKPRKAKPQAPAVVPDKVEAPKAASKPAKAKRVFKVKQGELFGGK